MNAQVILHGTLKNDGTLELDETPNLSPGRVRLTVEAVAPQPSPDRFWNMMAQIWSDLRASGHVPRTAEEIEAQRRAFRDEWDQRQEALEQMHFANRPLRQQADSTEEPSR